MRKEIHKFEDTVDFFDHQRIPISALERDNIQGDYPYYGAQGVIDYINDYIFDGEYVLIAEDGANLMTRNQPIARIVKGQFWVNNHAHIVRAKAGVSTNYFIAKLINSMNLTGYVTGVAQPKLSQKNLRIVEVNMPSFTEQVRITSILSAYDDLIENNRRRIALLEQSARLLYKEWFVRHRFPGHEHTTITDGVPEGWEKGTVGDISTRIKVSYTMQDEDLPLVDLSRIRSKTLSVVEVGSSEDLETSRIIFEADDILFSSIRPYLHKVVVAPFKGITNTSVFVVRANESYLRSYLAVLLSSDYTIAYANQHTTGTKMPVVKWAAVATMSVLVPSKAILEHFEMTVGPMLAQIKSFYFFNRRLAQARDLLLPRLMKGDVIASKKGKNSDEKNKKQALWERNDTGFA